MRKKTFYLFIFAHYTSLTNLCFGVLTMFYSGTCFFSRFPSNVLILRALYSDPQPFVTGTVRFSAAFACWKNVHVLYTKLTATLNKMLSYRILSLIKEKTLVVVLLAFEDQDRSCTCIFLSYM